MGLLPYYLLQFTFIRVHCKFLICQSIHQFLLSFLSMRNFFKKICLQLVKKFCYNFTSLIFFHQVKFQTRVKIIFKIVFKKNRIFYFSILLNKTVEKNNYKKFLLFLFYFFFLVYTFISIKAYDTSGLPDTLRSKYISLKTLGSGACGVVRMVYSKQLSKSFAVKEISKKKSGIMSRSPFDDPDRIMNEVKILQALKNVSTLYLFEFLFLLPNLRLKKLINI